MELNCETIPFGFSFDFDVTNIFYSILLYSEKKSPEMYSYHLNDDGIAILLAYHL